MSVGIGWQTMLNGFIFKAQALFLKIERLQACAFFVVYFIFC